MARKALPKTILKQVAQEWSLLGVVLATQHHEVVGDYFMRGLDDHTLAAPNTLITRQLDYPAQEISVFYDLDGRGLIGVPLRWRGAWHFLAFITPADVDYAPIVAALVAALRDIE